jgi:hypothetical protein
VEGKDLENMAAVPGSYRLPTDESISIPGFLNWAGRQGQQSISVTSTNCQALFEIDRDRTARYRFPEVGL